MNMLSEGCGQFPPGETAVVNGMFCPYLAGAVAVAMANPPMNRGAIICRPVGWKKEGKGGNELMAARTPQER